MKIAHSLTLELLVLLIHRDGTLEKGGSVAGRDCYKLTTGLGTYEVPSYKGFWAPCDFPSFCPPKPGARVNGPRAVLEMAKSDPAMLERLKDVPFTAQDLTSETLFALVKHHGQLQVGGNPAGRDCYKLVTESGAYMFRTYEGMAAPCDVEAFVPASASASNRTVSGSNSVLARAKEDEGIAALIESAA